MAETGLRVARFPDASNIGVKTGEQSGGLVDVDLDHFIAVELAREFLPLTNATFGRAGKPQSHWLYVCDTPGRTRRWTTADGVAIVELRGTGGQTMFPPSVHPSGEPVEWATRGEPLAVDWGVLERACADLAAAVRKSLGESVQDTATTGARNRLLARAARYCDVARPSTEGSRNQHAFSLAGHLAAFRDGTDRLSEAEILDVLSTRWNPRNTPPLSDKELAATVHSAMENGTPRADHPGLANVPDEPEPVLPAFITAADLIKNFPTQREPIIEGLLRRGEVGNLVGPSKMYKSWLLLQLALTAVFGRPVLGKFPTRSSSVLILDYELAPGTLARRLQHVASALAVTPGEIGDRLVIVTLRGKRLDIDALERYFATLTPRQFDLIIIDPLYKTFPREFDENSNVQLAEVYAKLQAYAERLDAAIIVVHHLTKGDQSFKATTDLGAGGGSQSRAADAHLAIRPHKEDGAAVLSGVVRSFPPFEPFAMRWTFPVWQRADDLNPADLKRPTRQKAKEVIPPPPPKPAWDVDRFVSSFVTSEPKPRVAIIAAAVEAGVPNNNQAANLLATAEALGKIHRWKQGKDKRAFFANRPQPTLPAVELPTSDIHTQKKKSPHTPLRRQKPLRGWGRFR